MAVVELCAREAACTTTLYTYMVQQAAQLLQEAERATTGERTARTVQEGEVAHAKRRIVVLEHRERELNSYLVATRREAAAEMQVGAGLVWGMN
jgi:hypothetical protein